MLVSMSDQIDGRTLRAAAKRLEERYRAAIEERGGDLSVSAEKASDLRTRTMSLELHAECGGTLVASTTMFTWRWLAVHGSPGDGMKCGLWRKPSVRWRRSWRRGRAGVTHRTGSLWRSSGFSPTTRGNAARPPPGHPHLDPRTELLVRRPVKTWFRPRNRTLAHPTAFTFDVPERLLRGWLVGTSAVNRAMLRRFGLPPLRGELPHRHRAPP
jgi:hypothetical protein